MTEQETLEPVRTLDLRAAPVGGPQKLREKEWLVTNGLGGYSSGTVIGTPTRRYHGLLVSALPSPLGRWVLLHHLFEAIHLPNGKALRWGALEHSDSEASAEFPIGLAEFRLELGLPVWRFEAEGFVFERRIFLPHEQNTVVVLYRLLEGSGPVRLDVRPAVNFRHHDGHVSGLPGEPYQLRVIGSRFELRGPFETALHLEFRASDGDFIVRPRTDTNIYFPVEAERGYDSRGELWSPGLFATKLSPGEDAALVASSEPWEILEAMTPLEALETERSRRRVLIEAAPKAARSGARAELVLAADQFLIVPQSRVEEAARFRAAGELIRTVIAGYHWFTDWGRDTMISLEGLTLATGRWREARAILRTFAHYVRDGLIPNYFPDGERDGLYHTADATLWFFHAMNRYRLATGDEKTLGELCPLFEQIARHHLEGTQFGIHVDPEDGLLVQGAEGYQLTWMDAKADDWVVTPRRGKAVEINALWYNALRLLASWCRDQDRPGACDLEHAAQRAKDSFNRRFWLEQGYLYDVVDGEGGDDASCRPNQIFAISLDHPILYEERWSAVLESVRERLLTPPGIRSLSPDHPDYKARYTGDLWSRDAAYHQGTAWAWLIGHFVDAWRKTHAGDDEKIDEFLDGYWEHLNDGCVGSLSEIFDGDPPHTPRGCIAQAWSVAELLRASLGSPHRVYAPEPAVMLSGA